MAFILHPCENIKGRCYTLLFTGISGVKILTNYESAVERESRNRKLFKIWSISGQIVKIRIY